MAAPTASPIGQAAIQDITVNHLQDQINWYEGRSGKSQRMYKSLKICTIVAAALIPALASVNGLAKAMAGLGVLIVVIEGLQQLNQYHSNWIAYRSTSESLKHEKFLYLARAGVYASANDPHALLAERVESLISQENTKWTSAQEQGAKPGSQGDRST